MKVLIGVDGSPLSLDAVRITFHQLSLSVGSPGSRPRSCGVLPLPCSLSRGCCCRQNLQSRRR
jgi:hypothetical protein